MKSKFGFNQKKKRSINMYLNGSKKGTICKQMSISLKTLDDWIVEYMKFNSAVTLSKLSQRKLSKVRLSKPAGYSQWIHGLLQVK